MTSDRELMQQALEALEEFCEHQTMLRPIEKRDALREALAEQPAHQKPVAWRYLTQYESGASIWTYCADEPANREIRQPLYTSPPASKPWVCLTEEENNNGKDKP